MTRIRDRGRRKGPKRGNYPTLWRPGPIDMDRLPPELVARFAATTWDILRAKPIPAWRDLLNGHGPS